MWNAVKSVTLSSICTKLVMGLIVIFGIGAPYFVKHYMAYTGKNPDLIVPLLITIYACCIPALIALYCLNRVLSNIKKDRIFIDKNVQDLRAISWCCFVVAGILLLSGYYYLLFLIVAAAAAFFGLILRVVKNVIEKAVILKQENELTI
ncbi:DUF2975 domain-containing protein [Anaerovorax sp. IOR16]|uniref:DUF2975 domain-containing protein n=1 Tax=Anaerovorax sp. IOR16 TaxID=2773458 RepID=UPI0019D15ABE|nr:DUF2975 domain-containing protein [Anaerovorax sp. IOR16]